MRVALGILLIGLGLVGAYFTLTGKILQPMTTQVSGATGPGSAAEKSSPSSLKVPGGTIYGSGGDYYASLGGMR